MKLLSYKIINVPKRPRRPPPLGFLRGGCRKAGMGGGTRLRRKRSPPHPIPPPQGGRGPGLLPFLNETHENSSHFPEFKIVCHRRYRVFRRDDGIRELPRPDFA